MDAFKDTYMMWLNAFLMLSCGCWLTQARNKAHTTGNHAITDTMFNHEIQYQETVQRVVYTTDGNDNNAPCVFPFIYKGKTYTECTFKDCKHGKLWCATTNNYDKDMKWGHCQTDNDAPDCMDRHSQCGEWALNGDCVCSAAFMGSRCPRSCGLCTFGGSGRGRACSFPFFYKDRVIHDCLQFNKKTWCATTVNYNKDKRWGYCFPKLYKDIKEVNRKYFNWGECDDRDKDCEKWANKSLCTDDPKKMDHWCPWTCHKCAPEKLVLHKECEDYSPLCDTLAKQGDCSKMPVFMFAFCRWTCRLCSKSSITTSVQDRMPKECRAWAQSGDCETHEEFMLQNCRQSCLAGGYVNGRMCLDNIANCHDWAKKGYCDVRENNRRYSLQYNMRKHCRYSCKWCFKKSTQL